jgi:hypothetical protein
MVRERPCVFERDGNGDAQPVTLVRRNPGQPFFRYRKGATAGVRSIT